ncbi:ribosomal protein S15 [Saguinus oedipus]|uniref:40S ribosomal protein S15 n=1 Tax=Saguinus oedipus TaxID=9490 RepID=A0ABQ9TZE3_SAGOE|nr:ribosomal protein S15 [Saguinus oedipus]
MAEAEQKQQRTFHKFAYRGTDLHQLLDMPYEQLMLLYSARQQRRLNPGLQRKQHLLLMRLRKTTKEAPPMEKPEVKPELETKPGMIGHYLGEFSITYKPVKHGHPGIGATRFIPLE